MGRWKGCLATWCTASAIRVGQCRSSTQSERKRALLPPATTASSVRRWTGNSMRTARLSSRKRRRSPTGAGELTGTTWTRSLVCQGLADLEAHMDKTFYNASRGADFYKGIRLEEMTKLFGMSL